MKKYELINRLIEKYDFKSYLEVGVQYGTNFSRKILKNGLKIWLIENAYVFHYYRFLEGIEYKNHLK